MPGGRSSSRLSPPAEAALSRLDRSGTVLSAGFGDVLVERTFLHFSEPSEASRRPRSASAPPAESVSFDELKAQSRLCCLTYKTAPVEAPWKAGSRSDGSRRLHARSVSVGSTTAEGDSVSEEFGSSDYPTSTRSLEGFAANSLIPMTDGALHMYDEALAWCHAEQSFPMVQPDFAQHDYASLAMSVPRDEFGALTSLGSMKHFEGSCKPCVFAHHSVKVCENGVLCPFCHFEHAPKRRAKINTKKRR